MSPSPPFFSLSSKRQEFIVSDLALAVMLRVWLFLLDGSYGIGFGFSTIYPASVSEPPYTHLMRERANSILPMYTLSLIIVPKTNSFHVKLSEALDLA